MAYIYKTDFVLTEYFWSHVASQRKSQPEESLLVVGLWEESTGNGKTRMEGMGGEER